MTQRIQGLDLARALAVFGMVLVNFKLVMGAQDSCAILSTLSGWVEGRAVATFVILAGIGVTLLSRRAASSGDAQLIKTTRWRLLRRAALLFFVGLSYVPIWPADILHFYGLYFVAGAFLFTASNRALWVAAASFTTGFVVLMLAFDYTEGWDFSTLEYLDFWTVQGMLRHLFFNGFHPVLPWAAFLFIGMWLGRLDLADAGLRRRLMVVASALWVLTEGLSKLAMAYVYRAGVEIPSQDLHALLGTGPMPPMPQYLVAAGSLAIVLIGVCLEISQRWGDAWWLRPLYATGKLSLTLYVAHVLIGMGTLEALGRLEGQSIEFAVVASLIFAVAGVAFSALWLRFFEVGPVEWVFRAVAR